MRNIGWALAILAATAFTSHANGNETAAGTIQLDSIGGTVASPIYNYTINLEDTGTTPIGTFWYSWVPGQDFLKSMPTVTGSPTGWGEVITGLGNSSDGFAIQWKALSSADDLAAGSTTSSFMFSSPDDLASVTGLSPTHPSTNVGTSFIYSGGPFSDAGFQFQVSAVPEPASIGFLFAAGSVLGLRRNRRRHGLR